jgi:hypothetical protein
VVLMSPGTSLATSIATSSAKSAPLFMIYCHVIIHVNLHVIIAIHVITVSTDTSYSILSMCDMAIEFVTKIILFVTFIFVIENGLGLGFGGRGHFMTISKRHGSSNL